MKFFRIAIVALLAAGLLLPGCGGKGSSGASSPQALFDELKGKDFENFSQIAGYIAPDELPFITFSAHMSLMMASAFSKDKKKFEDLQAKYKLPTPDRAAMMKMGNPEAALAYAVEKYKSVDHKGFIDDYSKLMDDSSKKKVKKEKIFAELKDVKINGDIATGTVVDKNGKSEKVVFKKAGGKWYLSIAEMMKAAMRR